MDINKELIKAAMNSINKELIKAALLIKNNCGAYGAYCKNCIFKLKGTCLISEYESPSEWQLNKIEVNHGK